MSNLINYGFIILDSTMNVNEIRILPKKLEEIIGLKITNKTEKYLFIEVKPNILNPKELIFR